MASTAVSTAVAARVAANWPYTWQGSPVAITDANGGGSVPDNNAPFLSIEFPVADEEMITIGAPGSNVFREDGAFRLVLSVPIGVELAPFGQWLDNLRAAFRAQLFGGVTTWGASPPVTNDRSDNGAYFEISSSVAYRFDLLA